MSKASDDVLAERARQISEEGWTPEHDDQQHRETVCGLAVAAGCYALFADSYPNAGQPPPQWPWDNQWWKPKNYRRDLVRAAALLVAEIERIDRRQTQGFGGVHDPTTELQEDFGSSSSGISGDNK